MHRNTPKNRNISRVDSGGMHGYLVRLMRRRKSTQKFFSDLAHGGKRKALAAAREFRDRIEADAPRPFSRKELARMKHRPHPSGVVGVRRVEETDHRWPSKPTYSYWEAQWSPAPGVRKTRRFSIAKYGNDEAFRLARNARKKGVREMEE